VNIYCDLVYRLLGVVINSNKTVNKAKVEHYNEVFLLLLLTVLLFSTFVSIIMYNVYIFRNIEQSRDINFSD